MAHDDARGGLALRLLIIGWVGALTHLVFGWTMAIVYPLGEFVPYRRPMERL